MRIEIGETIARLRLERDITQEQLAQAVGVSGPAVSKWETGQSYPDITMLPLLARYFDVTVDALLAYRPEPTEQGREELLEQVNQAFAAEGWEAGLAAADRLMREYPRDALLRIYLASELMSNMVYAENSDQKDEGHKRQIQWLQEAMQATEGKTQLTAQHLLGVFYLQRKQFDEAEAIFQEMLDLPGDSRQIMATLRMMQGEYEDAMRRSQRNLQTAINEVEMVLGTMTSLAIRQEDVERARQYAQAQRSVLALFGVSDSVLAFNAAQSALMVAGKTKDEALLLDAAEQYVDALVDMRRPTGIFFDKAELEQARQEEHNTEAIHAALADDWEKNAAFEAVRDTERFQALIVRLRA